jgi:hypothetical protein
VEVRSMEGLGSTRYGPGAKGSSYVFFAGGRGGGGPAGLVGGRGGGGPLLPGVLVGAFVGFDVGMGIAPNG